MQKRIYLCTKKPKYEEQFTNFRAIEQISTRIRACEQLQKFCEHEQASTRLNFASKSSKGQILRALENFQGPFNTPYSITRRLYANRARAEKYLMVYNLRYLSADIIFYEKLKENVNFMEQIMFKENIRVYFRAKWMPLCSFSFKYSSQFNKVAQFWSPNLF